MTNIHKAIRNIFIMILGGIVCICFLTAVKDNWKATAYKVIHTKDIGVVETINEIKSLYTTIPAQNKLLQIDSLRQKFFNYYIYKATDELIIRDQDGRLTELIGAQDPSILTREADNLLILRDYCSLENIPLVYIRAPYKAEQYADRLPEGMVDYSENNADEFCKLLTDHDVDVLDLRHDLTGEDVFYYTDHHWQISSAWKAASMVAAHVSEIKGFENVQSEQISDLHNYYTITYDDFLGSYGRRTGAVWSGTEKFTYILPDFDTEIHYQHKVDEKIVIDKTGDFRQALISDPDESDYYCSYLNNSYMEMLIDNLKPHNDKKVLLLSDSFGRTMGSFLSLYFDELVNLDTQDERYDDSILEYVDTYQPDIVMIMFNDGMFSYPSTFERLGR